jgi:hypothetical protein
MVSRHRSLLGWSLGLGSLLLTLEAEATAQGDPIIGHQADECWPEDQFPELQAEILPEKEILKAKVYFRSDKYPDFYFVEMTTKGSAENFLAILPKPGPETDRVIYYLEAVDSTFNGARTEEYDPDVEDPCKRSAPAAYIGTDPGIVVGATKAGAAAVPPGFQAAGIVGFITAAGVSTAAGSGLGIGTAVAVAGVAAGAAGAVAASGGAATTTIPPAAGPPSTTSVLTGGATTTTVAPATTTTTRTTTSTTSVPGATTTIPATTTVGSTTSGASTSTTTVIPSTTTTTIGSTTTSSSTTTTIAAPPVSACFTATKLNSCVWEFDASCSTGPIVQYNWVIDPGGNMPGPRPPVNHSGTVVVVNWNPPAHGGCSGAPLISVQLTVVGSGGQTDSVGQGVRIDLKPFTERGGLRTSFSSFLSIPPHSGGASGFVVVNDARVDATSDAAPSSHVFGGLASKNTIEAHREGEVGSEGFWKFDFSAADRFVPGSLRAGTGTVVSFDGRSIVFRLNGAVGERIKFTFDLAP